MSTRGAQALVETRVDVFSADPLLEKLLSHDHLSVHDDVVDTAGETYVFLRTARHIDGDSLRDIGVPNDEIG